MKKVLKIVVAGIAGSALYMYGRYTEYAQHKEEYPKRRDSRYKEAADGMYCHACGAQEDVNDAIEHLECAADSIQNILSIWHRKVREPDPEKGGDKDGETAGSPE